MIRRLLAAPVRSVADAGLALASAVAFAAHVLVFIPGFGLGLIFLLPWPILQLRRVPTYARRRFAVEPGYQPEPPKPQPDASGRYAHDRRLYKSAYWPTILGKLEWLLSDRAFGRDLVWLFANAVFGLMLALAPLALATAAATAAAVKSEWWLPAIPAALAIAPLTTAAYAAMNKALLGPPPPLGRVRVWFGIHLIAMFKVIALAGLTVLSLAFAALGVVVLALFCVGLVIFLPPYVERLRWLTALRRKLAGEWSGVAVDQPYRPRPPLPVRRPDGLYAVGKNLYRSPQWTRYNQRFNWIWHDPATWRDLLWTETDPIVGAVPLLLPVATFIGGIWFVALPSIWYLAGIKDAPHWSFISDYPYLAIPVGLAAAVAGLALAPAALKANGGWTELLLAPTKQARLALRVQHLTESRTELTESQAAELRRIERDLHDGAQARLVAIGITLGAVDALLDTDPAGARALLAEARGSSALALAELRDLVRGIHPPVLAERGLGDAVRALVLNAGLPATVEVHLDGRPEAPVEAAVYFAISELLANAAKHSGAQHITVDLVHDGYALVVVVRDDGRGGAAARADGGLRGVTRRLDAFDGTVAVDSPPGGPTTVTLEVPCVLSSPRTSISFAKG
jgi:signal transduction histidine kinase